MITTNITMELSAVCVGFIFASSFMAAIPKGVAALPKPSRLAVIFMQIALIAGLPFLQDGNKRRVSGSIILARMAVSPPASAIFISPVHAHIIPSIAITSSTAPAAPLITAAESWGTRPVATAQKMLTRISPAQI